MNAEPIVIRSTAAPVTRFTNYAGMVDAMRALKAWIGLSNEHIEAMCKMAKGRVDKALGPSCSRTMNPDTFDDLAYVLCAEFTVTLNVDLLRELEQHWEQRNNSQLRERPGRISKRVVAYAKPIIFREHLKRANAARNAKLSCEQRSAIARKAARARWGKPRKRKRRRAVRCTADAGAASSPHEPTARRRDDQSQASRDQAPLCARQA
jgi:hypothetical protein